MISRISIRPFALSVALFFVFLPTVSFALTPIAHTDVVPYQRIEYGTSFNFGVVAFSKAGINRVEFVISGQGYSGGTKTSSPMTLNTRVATTSPGAERDGVWEYYVAISTSEFTSNGTITVTPTVYGNDSGTKSLPAVTLYVEGASNESPTEAWVDPWSNDGAGTLDDVTDPYPTIAAAVSAIESANGDCDYAKIYLAEGTYNDSNEFGSGETVDTTSEWLTITKESGANIENVIIDEDNSIWNGSGLVKFESVTFATDGASDWALNEDGSWLDGCRMIGTNQCIVQALPVANVDYITGCYFYQTPIAFGIEQKLARGNKLKETHDDFGRYLTNTSTGILVVNNELDENYGTYAGCHSDMFQADSEIHNIIYFCNIFTGLHYQSLFVDSDGDSSNIALVNNLFEFNDTGSTNLRGWLFDHFDHLLLWHNTSSSRHGSASGHYDLYIAKRADCVGTMRRTNVSHIGNVWDQMLMNTGAQTDLGTNYLDSGNSYGNEGKYNHYMTGSTYGENYSTGTSVIDFDTPGSATFGYPAAGSTIIDRLPSNLTGVPCDAYGNPRDSTPDVGALERSSSSITDAGPPQIDASVPTDTAVVDSTLPADASVTTDASVPTDTAVVDSTLLADTFVMIDAPQAIDAAVDNDGRIVSDSSIQNNGDAATKTIEGGCACSFEKVSVLYPVPFLLFFGIWIICRKRKE